MKSYVFDTNVLLRYFLEDLEIHYTKAVEVVREIEDEKAIGRLSIVVVAETIWTFGSVYKLDRNIILEQLLQLIALKNMRIIETKKNILIEVLKKMIKNKFDFVDNYLSEISTKEEIFSFDKDFKRLFR